MTEREQAAMQEAADCLNQQLRQTAELRRENARLEHLNACWRRVVDIVGSGGATTMVCNTCGGSNISPPNPIGNPVCHWCRDCQAPAFRQTIAPTEHDSAILSAAVTWATVHDEYLDGHNTREESDRLALELLEAVRAYWRSLPPLPKFES